MQAHYFLVNAFVKIHVSSVSGQDSKPTPLQSSTKFNHWIDAIFLYFKLANELKLYYIKIFECKILTKENIILIQKAHKSLFNILWLSRIEPDS